MVKFSGLKDIRTGHERTKKITQVSYA